jgi:hypothetical protein
MTQQNQGDNPALWGRRRLLEETMRLALKINSSKLPIECIINVGQDGKTEILVDTKDLIALYDAEQP